MTVLVWHTVGGVLDRFGRPPPRDGLVYGDYEPEAAATYGETGFTAGLSNAALLTDYNSSGTLTHTLLNGETITNKTVYGDLRLPTSHSTDIVLTNCLLRGGSHIPSTNDGIVKADNARSGTGRIILSDCEVWPQLVSLNRDGVRGNRIEIYRSWIHDTIDGFVPYATPSQNSGNAYAYMYGCVIERLPYFYPDYDNGVSGAGEHTDGTHNDAVAISGGKNIHIQGNLIKATGYAAPGQNYANSSHPDMATTGDAHGSGMIITNTVSNPLDNTVIVEENWFTKGNSQVNIKANMTCIFRNNRHYRAIFIGSTSSGYWIRYDQRSGNGVTANNSIWVDGPWQGQTLIEPRDRGVHFNA